ncbi:proline-rich protein 3 [Manihot esculenta]|nr:proline-rich protein 3 [Manihot esculenta]
MASTSFFLSMSVLLLSLLVIASAADYGYYVSEPHNVSPSTPTSENEYIPKPDSELAKPHHPKPKYDTTKPESDYVKSDVNEYGQKPKPEFDYVKSDVNEYDQKPKPENNYSSKPYSDTKKPEDGYTPKSDSDKSGYGYSLKSENPLQIGVEGLVLCKSGSSYVPVEGAMARITCSAMDQNGYETTPFSCLTSATDAKGYFFKTLSLFDLFDNLKLKDCKVNLEKSPSETCNIPTDVNKGITGAVFSSYRILHEKKIKLYSVGPFFYTSESKSTPAGY